MYVAGLHVAVDVLALRTCAAALVVRFIALRSTGLRCARRRRLGHDLRLSLGLGHDLVAGVKAQEWRGVIDSGDFRVDRMEVCRAHPVLALAAAALRVVAVQVHVDHSC